MMRRQCTQTGFDTCQAYRRRHTCHPTRPQCPLAYWPEVVCQKTRPLMSSASMPCWC